MYAYAGKEAKAMKTLLKNALLWQYAPAPAFVAGELLIEGDRIVAQGAPDTLDAVDARVLDMKGARIAPGLVDIHTHGRAGSDFVSADAPSLARMARSYAGTGTTSVMPTLASAPMEDYVRAAERIATASRTEGGARYLGLHLEGRYLNPQKRGAHAEHLLAPLDESELSALHERMCRPSPFRLSAAFELDADGSFASRAKSLGMSLSLAHTAATYDEATQAIDAGVSSLTHLFNAMPPLHHRAGGAVVACFDAAANGKDVMGELICDGLHISPEMVRLAYRALGRDHTILITDSMEGTGCPDGHYTIAGQAVLLQNGRACTEDGALAGSTLSLMDAVRNLCAMCQVPLEDAILCATRNPASMIGMQHIVGSLDVGCCADLLMLDAREPTLLEVWLGGKALGEVTA